MATLQVTPQQVKFGARLAHTEKPTRDNALAQLSAFMAKQAEMQELQMLKVWKGLFYCMWMSDKAPIQNELADTLAKVCHACNDRVGLLYCAAFFKTMEREWHGIDALRMDKFYRLVRRVVHESFALASARKWKRAQEVAEMFAAGPLRKAEHRVDQAPLGFLNHLVDIFWEELVKQTGEVLPEGSFPLFAPLVAMYSHTWNPKLQHRIDGAFFENLLAVQLVDGQPLPMTAIQNESLVVLLCDQVGETAKAADTRPFNRDGLYGQWKKLRAMVKQLKQAQAMAEEMELENVSEDVEESAVEKTEPSTPVEQNVTKRTGKTKRSANEKKGKRSDAAENLDSEIPSRRSTRKRGAAGVQTVGSSKSVKAKKKKQGTNKS